MGGMGKERGGEEACVWRNGACFDALREMPNNSWSAHSWGNGEGGTGKGREQSTAKSRLNHTSAGSATVSKGLPSIAKP